jgi:hypothetical protein
MNRTHQDVELLMNGDWSKAFVALNQNDASRLTKLRRRFVWLNILLPKRTVKNVLTKR